LRVACMMVTSGDGHGDAAAILLRGRMMKICHRREGAQPGTKGGERDTVLRVADDREAGEQIPHAAPVRRRQAFTGGDGGENMTWTASVAAVASSTPGAVSGSTASSAPAIDDAVTTLHGSS
jgi:hypothetical protein